MKNFKAIIHLSAKKRDKISDLIFDVVKYMITAELVAFMFSDMSKWKWYNFLLTIVVIIGMIVVGFFFMNDNNNEKQ